MITYDDTTNETEEYATFVEKFKPKKTTDDCYTPNNIMNTVTSWAVKEYALHGRRIIRPFYPDGDYESIEYPVGSVVIDNPPFSILTQICRFYDSRGIDYFLFAPLLTLFSINAGKSNYIISDCKITYENGATVNTAFVTNLGEYKIRTAPELYLLIKKANDENTKSAVSLPKYEYPDCVCSAANLQKIARHVEFSVKPEDAVFIRAMDSQRAAGKAIFGGGFLLSEKAAAEKAAAEKAAAEKAAALTWKLSEREREIQKRIAVKEGE